MILGIIVVVVFLAAAMHSFFPAKSKILTEGPSLQAPTPASLDLDCEIWRVFMAALDAGAPPVTIAGYEMQLKPVIPPTS